MPKELIVSVNGREKKIAIIENGRVTEFYIERGESSQGIVGNIYKGRVMRVLPGMQSAFVDIGLERDAFLYVSDFFDEEEEFERIVVDKTRTEGADADSAARAAAERIERSRVERERQIEAAQDRAEPIAVGAEAEDEEEEIAEQPVAPAPQAQAEERETDGGGRGRRRGRGGRERERESPRADRGEQYKKGGAEIGRGISREEIATPFAAGASSFERIVDDEAAVEEGSMFKDARLQERLTDQTRAVEFDMEATTSAEVGSLLSTAGAQGSSFQRVDDSDEGPTEGRSRSVQREVAASVAHLVGEFDDEAAGVPARGREFERVSDDERDAGAAVASPGATQAEGGARGRRGASKKAASKKGAKKSAASEEASGEKPKKGAKKSAAKTASKTAAKKSSSKKTAAKGGARGKKSGAMNEADRESQQEAAAADSAPAYEDSEARVKAPSSRGEFARRGGRRRRRTGPAGSGEDRPNGNGGEAEVIVEVSEPEAEAPSAPKEQRPASKEHSSRGRGRRDEGRRDEGRRDESRRDEGRREEGGQGNGRGRGGRDRGGRDRSQPTITDLLREGQEIIVQIAKEPIAQKGARITSHIALPGRFLVYMPTVDHVGVSRKIESDQERVRLRKLIQKIVKEEDVPSGGFIVRTAGVGISEQDLRDDARYLVRTWRDIRRNAEKQKAPALAHKDLDLVQRILRDQLSDDFTAIRIDSEEEYLDVVEFVNRIQPRLVNRVKLYTRETPILEAFAVEAEIEKAIKPRVWLKSGGYLVINQTEALVAIDVNTGKFVGRGGTRLEDTITRTNLEAVDEIARQIRLRDLGGIIVLDLIDMEERRNRQRVMTALQDALRQDKSPTKVLSFNDFGLVIMTRKRVKQSLERTLCSPCPYCQGAGLVKSPQTVCYEILEEARRLSRANGVEDIKQTTLRVNPEIARTLRSTERDVLREIEDYLGSIDITSDERVHQEQFDFAFI